MISYIVRRLRLAIPVLRGVVTLVFPALRLIPGDPALVMAGEAAPQDVGTRIHKQLGPDPPLTVQYGIYIWNLLRGDLGQSARTRRPVAQELGFRLPATLELASASMATTIFLGLAAGILAATRHYSILDYGTLVGAPMGISIPVFCFGLILVAMWIFSVKLGWFPVAGTGTLRHLVP